MTRLCAIFLFLLVSTVSSFAVDPEEILEDTALETRARAISAELRCLVCQNQSIDDSDAELARDLRVLVRERLVAGDSDAEVMAFVVDRYGEFVLLKPTFSARNALLWIAPILVFLLGAIGFWSHFRRRPTEPITELTTDEQARLSDILGDGDQRDQ